MFMPNLDFHAFHPMFLKLAVVIASFITLVTSQTVPPVTPPTSPQCCNAVVPATNTAAMAVAKLLGLDISSLDVDVGLSCTPITVVGNNCGGTTVVCDAPDKEWGGLIAINCVPFHLR
ncbi:hydrophobin 2 [Mycena vulgaris]|nr:hydrophobin 2 [Mycena vulgaris]